MKKYTRRFIEGEELFKSNPNLETTKMSINSREAKSVVIEPHYRIVCNKGK